MEQPSTPFILVDDHRGAFYPLSTGSTTLGREFGDIRIPMASLSKRQFELVVTGSTLTVEDLQSVNGTYVDGERITEPTWISIGQRFYAGQLVLHVETSDWLGADAPGRLCDRDPESGTVERLMAGEGAPDGQWDAAWADWYARWRRFGGDPGPLFTAGARIASPALLARVAEALHEPVRWFLGEAAHAGDMFSESEHAEAAILAFHASVLRGVSSVAGVGAYRIAQRCGRLQQVLIESWRAASPSVTHSTTLLAVAARRSFRWTLDEFVQLLGRPDFAEAARSVVFRSARSNEPGRLFRPADGEWLGVDEPLILPYEAEITVPTRTPPAWEAHLADYEVVRPFFQHTLGKAQRGVG